MSGLLDKLYLRSPIFVQNFMVTMHGLRIYRREYGKSFWKKLDECEKLQWKSFDQIKDYQNAKLASLVEHAYTHVPYYRKVMDERKLKPTDIRITEDLSKLPVVSRSDVKENLKDLVSKNHSKRELIMGHTSGTTGSPLTLMWDKDICLMKTVVDWRQKRIAGINIGDSMAFFLGRTIVPLSQKNPPYWRHNKVLNHVFCSSWHLSKENLPSYFDMFESYSPKAIEGYPSTMYILANYLLSKDRRFPLKAVFTSSETLFDYQRQAIEEAFQCELYDFYGMAERAVFATECEHHDGKHINMDFGIVEVLDGKGNPAEDGALGRIVATSFHNYGMPLIRYQTSDITSLKTGKCRCGRNFTMMENVTTKDEDIITSTDGRYISSSILNALTHHMTSIIEHQIIQESRDRTVVKMVVSSDFTDNDSEFLINGLHGVLGEDMNIELEFVDEIPRTNAGKYRWVISKVPLEF